MDDDALLVHRFNSLRWLFAIIEVAVRVILDNQDAVLFSKRVNSLSLFKAHRHAGRVLEIGNGINKTDIFSVLSASSSFWISMPSLSTGTPTSLALYERNVLSEPIKLGASQMTVSPRLKGIFPPNPLSAARRS